MKSPLIALFLAGAPVAAGCQSVAGLADFTPDDGAGATTGSSGEGGQGAGGEGAGGAVGTGTGGAPPTSSSSSSSSSASSTTSSSSSGGGCFADHLLIAEVRTRGPSDGGHDFVELLNPTAAPILLDPSYSLDARGEGTTDYVNRWIGDGTLTVPPGGRVLLANDADGNPLGGQTADATYTTGIRDGGGIQLLVFGEVVDTVCFTCEEATLDGDFGCEGTPLARSASCGVAGDQSVRRRVVGGVAGCADTGDNAADLEEVAPSTPEGLD